VGLKSGLGPGARGGRAVTLGRNAEEVVVEGNDIGKLYRCFKALLSQHGGEDGQSETYAAHDVRLPILLNVHS
jgi:hypothetical protein